MENQTELNTIWESLRISNDFVQRLEEAVKQAKKNRK